jgi:predicted nucleotidyltransferase
MFRTVPTLEKVVMFGSRAMGSHRPGSDVDLMLYGATLNDIIYLYGVLDESDLPYHFDLAMYDESNHALNTEIVRNGKTIYSNTSK